jgi:flagellar basal-body rod modification protein FlgD
MTDINTTTATNPLLRELAIKPQENSKELDKNAFLELMVAQLNNQDPLNPQENGEFIAQLAQFSSVEGIENLNNTVEVMSSSLQSSQALQASALVGRKVHILSDKSFLAQGSEISGSIKLDRSTTDLKLNISNGAGVLIDQIELGSQTRGDIRFAWNGKDADGVPYPEGEYQFTAEADIDGATEEIDLALSANVDSVSINPDRSVLLNIQGQGAVPLLDVEEIL